MIQNKNYSVNVGGKLVDLSTPKVMSIVNVTPDSFWSGSRKQSDLEIVTSIQKAINDGADFIDIGGYSTRPGAAEVSQSEEVERVCNALKIIEKSFGHLDIPISIDTFRSEVVRRAFDTYGAFIVNDIAAGDDDDMMLETVANLNLPYIAMHKKGTPKTMSKCNQYDDIVGDIISYFASKIDTFNKLGIYDVILDIGFGFAKNAVQNFELIRRYDEFSVMGLPTLAGISRKRMIWQTLDVDVSEALNGTTALHWELLRNGANILRVHDTKEAVQTVKLFECVMQKKDILL